MRRILMSLSTVLVLAAAGPLMAHAMEEGSLMHSAVPQIEPVVLGEVTATTAHSVTVNTLDHEAMAFDFDSRTVMPLDLATGTRVRVEWHMLDSGLHLAQRITPLTRGSKDWDVIENRMAEAYLQEDEDSEDIAPATYNGEDTHASTAQSTGVSEREEHGESNATEARENEHGDNGTGDANENREANDTHEVASTASDLPLFLGAGLLLLAGAVCLRWMRRRSA